MLIQKMIESKSPLRKKLFLEKEYIFGCNRIIKASKTLRCIHHLQYNSQILISTIYF